jgi:hypothetical protein
MDLTTNVQKTIQVYCYEEFVGSPVTKDVSS